MRGESVVFQILGTVTGRVSRENVNEIADDQK